MLQKFQPDHFTCRALAMGIKVRKNRSCGVSGSGQSGSNQADPFLFSNNLDFGINFHVVLQLLFQVSCNKDNRFRFLNLRYLPWNTNDNLKILSKRTFLVISSLFASLPCDFDLVSSSTTVKNGVALHFLVSYHQKMIVWCIIDVLSND